MGGDIRTLFFIGLTLAIAVSVSGCALPGGSPKVYGPISPTPTPVPGATAALAPSPSAAPMPSPTPVAAMPPVDAGGNISRAYRWEYGGVDWEFTAVVQQAKYDLFKAKSHSPDLGLASYAMASEDRDLLQSAARQLVQGGAGYGYTRLDDAANAIAFVQSIPCIDDHPSGSPRYPLETLADGRGDCEDKAVLAAALLREMGFDAALLQFPRHVALGLNAGADGTGYPYGGVRYYYVETTGPGWKIGVVPDDLRGAGPTVLPLVKNPALTVTVAAVRGDEANGYVDYRAQYAVTNTGPGTAKRVVLTVRAMALSEGENVYYEPEQTVELDDLAEGQTARSDVLLTVPAGKRSRIVGVASGENADPAQASTADFVT